MAGLRQGGAYRSIPAHPGSADFANDIRPVSGQFNTPLVRAPGRIPPRVRFAVQLRVSAALPGQAGRGRVTALYRGISLITERAFRSTASRE
jgi:hypothetical protein